MKTYRIHLIRHALTQDNLEGLYCGITDSPLCDEGENQLRDAMKAYTYPRADFVFSSPLKRCIDTAKILYPDLKPMEIDGLRECDFGEFEGKSADELHGKFPIFDQWLAGEKGIKPPFGEGEEEFSHRICSTFTAIVDGIIKTGSDNVAIITHGGVISTLMANFALPEGSVSEWMTPSCCGYTLRVTPYLWMSGKKVEAISEIPEIPQEESNYYEGWDWYPDDSDFDISEFVPMDSEDEKQ